MEKKLLVASGPQTAHQSYERTTTTTTTTTISCFVARMASSSPSSSPSCYVGATSSASIRLSVLSRHLATCSSSRSPMREVAEHELAIANNVAAGEIPADESSSWEVTYLCLEVWVWWLDWLKTKKKKKKQRKKSRSWRDARSWRRIDREMTSGSRDSSKQESFSWGTAWLAS